jgi:hypothetical protein
MVVPKGKATWLAYVSEFVEEAKAAGLVQKATSVAGHPALQCRLSAIQNSLGGERPPMPIQA